jgi:hypothetical protein
MKPISAVEFRNRPMQVKVLTYCDPCQTLKEDVASREHAQYWPTVALKITSCLACFEVAKKAAIDEARAANASYC